MEADKPTTMICTLLAIDNTTGFSYRVCFVCERTLLDNPYSLCKFCSLNSFNPCFPRSKLLLRLLMSIASDTKVLNVICFDRAAKVLFGCSADEFFDFANYSNYVDFELGSNGAAVDASRILDGEKFRLTLSKPKNGNAQHLRAVQVIPLRSGFQPAVVSLRQLYGVRSS